MSGRILFWGAPISVEDALPVRSAFEQTGFNFGNLLIGSSVYSLLEGNEIIFRKDVSSPAEADERCTHAVIPAANFLWKEFDLGEMYEFLRQTKLPITIVGLGAQTSDRTTISPVHPNTLKLVKLISERSHTLGVRGFYTAEVLAANGIHNVSVLGCPSLYSSGKPSIRIDVERLKGDLALSVNFSRRVSSHSFNPSRLQALENVLLKLAINQGADFVAQDEVEEIGLAAGESVDIDAICTYFSQSNASDVEGYFKSHTRYFRNVASWAGFIRSKSASIGGRFHGNLIALTNGTPALMIAHDSRTMEMCALMGCPYVHLSQIEESSVSEEWLLERLRNASFTMFESSYRQLFVRFLRFMDLNGLSCRLSR